MIILYQSNTPLNAYPNLIVTQQMKVTPQLAEHYNRQAGTQGMLQAGPVFNQVPDQSPAAVYRANSIDTLNKPPGNGAAPQSYCHRFCGYWSKNREFWFYEFLSGNMLKNFFKSIGLGCMASESLLEAAAQGFQKRCTPRWMPLVLRPFLTGLFLPMILLFWFDLAYLRDQSKDSDPLSDTQQAFMVVSYFITLIMFIIVGVKDPGSIDTPALRQRSNDILRAKPYLRASDNYCTICDMIKPLRSHHCQQCGICVAKYTKHSIFLNKCIGAGNELLYLLMVTAFIWTVSVVLDVFVFQPLKGWLIIKIVFYFMNAHLQLQSAAEALEGLFLNTVYNVTRYEIVYWEGLNYLNVPEKGFQNPNNLGFWNNIGEMFMNMTCGGRFQPHQLSFLELSKQPPNYMPVPINWTISLMFHPAQIPNNPNRHALAEAAHAAQSQLLQSSSSNRKDRQQLLDQYGRKKQRKLLNNSTKSDQGLQQKEDQQGMPNHHVIQDELN